MSSFHIGDHLSEADPRKVDTGKLRDDASKLKSSVSLPSFDRPSISWPHIELPHIAALDDAGKAAGDMGRDVGRQAASAVGNAGRAVGGVIETAGDRLRDLRTSVSPAPERPSGMGRGIIALVIASVIGSVAAGAAFFFHPVRGAARRTALRRRLLVQAELAKTGMAGARDVALRATDRAADLVRGPVESARDMVGSRGQSNAEDSSPEWSGAGFQSASTASFPDIHTEVGSASAGVGSSSWTEDALVQDATAAWTEGAPPADDSLTGTYARRADDVGASWTEGTPTEEGAAAGIYGTPNVIDTYGDNEALAGAEDRAKGEAVGE